MYKARLVRAITVGAALAVVVGGCAQNAQQSGGGGGTKSGGGSTGNSSVDIKADPPPDLPKDVRLPAGDGKGKCSSVTIAYIGTIAGANPALGKNIYQGAQLAIDQHNKANKDCQVKFRKFDTGGSPDSAPGVVTQAIADKTILGVVGLPFSGESKAVGATFNEAGLVTVTPAATNPELATHGWKTFFRALGNDAVQGPAIAKFLTEQLKAKKACIVRDDSEYGIGLADQVTKALGSKASCQQKVKTGQKEFSAVVGAIASAKPDAIFYSGYYAEAAPFAQQLRDQGVKAPLVGPDGVRDDEYVKNAGSAAEGTYLSCPCLPSNGFKEFYDAYKSKYGQEPSTYTPEGYDVTTILLQGLDKGLKTRAQMLDFVKNYKGQGLTKYYEFGSNGEVKQTPVWMYVVKNGQIEPLKDMTVNK